ncbi:SRPBCC family protein [Streptomyces sp. NPDC047002]|uniref:SRPBCC family protein n=1 Tax=Streptomyces sp. NPDC047002 TaxID=3155475 RepID=UPI003455D932
MASTQQGGSALGGLVKRALKEEASRRFDASVGGLADRASGAVSRATGLLTDLADNDGRLPRPGGPSGGGPLSSVAALAGLGQSAPAALAGKAKDAVKGAKDTAEGATGSGGSGHAGDTKVTSIIEVLDIGKPLRTVYDHWTRYEDFNVFTKGVQSVTQNDDATSDWSVKIAFSTRSFSATVQEQIPDERIAWTSQGAKGSTQGAVSFHDLAPDLTRVVAVVEYYPSGFFEKTGNLWRAQGRRLRLDLKHFARHVTLTDEEPDGWRGEIRDGEVVRSHEDAVRDEEARDNGDDDRCADEDAEPDDSAAADDAADSDDADDDGDGDYDEYDEDEEYEGDDAGDGEGAGRR